ncbi:MAG TPA: DUF2460 domain-containing protein [Zoogloea sp.]|uniref:phage head spike fiber domain-containing protein n=1 Tax=Zoogloea sp. TaxID=49181 RepID=UPI002C305666|nr:DUF2460 domain-containing protein [Zoogloea sp.]HNI47215.1 DUF2460 domain-containing protein [Zoogloea sp.]
MSNEVFPTLPGLAWGATREPIWKNKAAESASGLEQRAGYESYPRWLIKLSYEFLRAGAEAELQTLLGFFNARGGDLDSFLWADPLDHTATAQQFGTGDGATTTYRLGRTLGGAYEPISAVSGVPVIEEQHNYLASSQTLGDAVWTQITDAYINVTANATTAPDGSATADKLIEADTSTGSRYLKQVMTGMPDNVSATFSVYLKAAERSWAAVSFIDKAGGTVGKYVNLATGVFGGNTGGTPSAMSITDAGSGWWRVSITSNTGTGGTPFIRIWICNGDGVYSFPGVVNNGLYAWGAQVVEGAAPQDYLPTATAAPKHTTTLDTFAGKVTFSGPPAAGAILSWSGEYLRRVRFERGSQEFREFLQDLWEAKTVSLLTVKTT